MNFQNLKEDIPKQKSDYEKGYRRSLGTTQITRIQNLKENTPWAGPEKISIRHHDYIHHYNLNPVAFQVDSVKYSKEFNKIDIWSNLTLKKLIKLTACRPQMYWTNSTYTANNRTITIFRRSRWKHHLWQNQYSRKQIVKQNEIEYIINIMLVERKNNFFAS